MRSILSVLAAATMSGTAGQVAAADASAVRSFERDGVISYLVSEQGLITASTPSGVVLPSPAGAPHVCDEDFYPAMDARLRHRGRVLLSMQIDTKGRIQSLAIKEPIKYARLNIASLDCVHNWTYSPALRDGVPVTAEHTIQVTWLMTSEE